jgi:hypothetical protein
VWSILLFACASQADIDDELVDAYCIASVRCEYWTDEECASAYDTRPFVDCDVRASAVPACLDAMESSTCSDVVGIVGGMEPCRNDALCLD